MSRQQHAGCQRVCRFYRSMPDRVRWVANVARLAASTPAAFAAAASVAGVCPTEPHSLTPGILFPKQAFQRSAFPHQADATALKVTRHRLLLLPGLQFQQDPNHACCTLVQPAHPNTLTTHIPSPHSLPSPPIEAAPRPVLPLGVQPACKSGRRRRHSSAPCPRWRARGCSPRPPGAPAAAAGCTWP
jgi:hypothetical protein